MTKKKVVKKINCSRCGRFVGQDGKHDVFYDDWTGGYECGYPLCGKCLSKDKKKGDSK